MQVAKTIHAVAEAKHPLVHAIINREFQLNREFVAAVMGQSQFSWHGRRPKPAVDSEGRFRKTNLDLLSLLTELYKRQAHIELNAYENQLPWRAYAGEQHVGGTKRFGPIVGLTSHRDHLSFSVRINDLSIVSTKNGEPTAGAARNYMLADYFGRWHAGWHGLSWQMNEAEAAYLKRRKLLSVDGSVDFEDYIHQNRRQSIYGAPYLMLKLLWQRIEDELAFYEAELKRLQSAGVECPTELGAESKYLIASGDSTSIEVPVFRMKVSGLKFVGQYTSVLTDEVGYRLTHRMIRFLMHELRPIVQFMVRADEAAFYRFAMEQSFKAHWVRNNTWVFDTKSDWVTMELDDNLSVSYQEGLVEKKVAA